MKRDVRAEATHQTTEDRRLAAWAMYHDPDDDRTIAQMSASLGVSRQSFHKYIAALTIRFKTERSDEMAKVLGKRLASSSRILAKVEARLLTALADEGDPELDEEDEAKRILLDIKGLHDVYAKRLEQESKWLGLNAPEHIKVETTDDSQSIVDAMVLCSSKAEMDEAIEDPKKWEKLRNKAMAKGVG